MAFKDRFYDVPVVGTALRVQDRYTDDAGNQFAAAMGFFGFLSLFPVLLLALSVAGYVLADDPARQAEIVTSIERAIPGLSAAAGGADGQTVVGRAMRSITANPGAVGLVGLVTLLLAGLRVVDSAMTATQRVFGVEVEQRLVAKKLRQLGALFGLGLLALLGIVIASSVGALARSLASPLDTASVVIGPVVALALDFALFIVAYRVLAMGEGPAWRDLVPGALLAAIGWTGLKLFGSTYVSSQVARANELYGTLGGVIGLLLLLFLAGRLYVYGAELAAVTRDPGGDTARRDDGETVSRAAGEPGDDRDGAPHVAPPPDPTHESTARPTAPRSGMVGRTRAPATEEPAVSRATDTTEAPAGAVVSAGPHADTPRPDERGAAVSAATADRLALADRRNERSRDPHYVRKGIAFALAIGVVGGLVYAIRPGPPE